MRGARSRAMSDLDHLKKLEKQNLENDWKRHREDCLKLAAQLGATSAEQAIEIAEKLGAYIRNGKPDEPKT